MATLKKQYYGIKFPLTSNNLQGMFIDLNKDMTDKVASEIAHVLLTPKRSRLRMPEFGTDLMKFIFSDNVESDWDAIKNEAHSAVGRYVPNATLNEIEIIRKEDDEHSVYLSLSYTVQKGNKTEDNRSIIKI